MRATEEAAFWLYSAKDWIDGMNAFVPDRLKAYALSMACEMLLKYCIVINGGSPPEAHSHVLLAQEVGKLGGQVPKDVRIHLRTIKEYEARSRYDMTYVVHPEGVNTIIPVVTKWYHVLYGEFCRIAAEQLREKLPPALRLYSDEEIVDNYKNLLE